MDKKISVTFKLSEIQKKELIQIGKDKDLNFSQVLRRATDEYIKKNKKNE